MKRTITDRTFNLDGLLTKETVRDGYTIVTREFEHDGFGNPTREVVTETEDRTDVSPGEQCNVFLPSGNDWTHHRCRFYAGHSEPCQPMSDDEIQRMKARELW